MTKTENGNMQKELSEFAAELKALLPGVALCNEDLERVYGAIAPHYIICKPELIDGPKWANEHARLSKFIKPECLSKYKFVYVHLSYDCGPLGFCPQDCPYKELFVNIESGDVWMLDEVIEAIRSKKK